MILSQTVAVFVSQSVNRLFEPHTHCMNAIR